MFLWRVIVGGLPLAMALKRRHISNGTCFFCAVVEEDARHKFITCPVAKAIWIVISQIWVSITSNILSPFNWMVFMMIKACSHHHIRSCLITLGIGGFGLIGL